MLPDFKIHYKAIIIIKLASRDRHIEQWNRIESRNKPSHKWSNNFQLMYQGHSMGKGLSSENGAGKIGYYGQKDKVGPLPNTICKNELK